MADAAGDCVGEAAAVVVWLSTVAPGVVSVNIADVGAAAVVWVVPGVVSVNIADAVDADVTSSAVVPLWASGVASEAASVNIAAGPVASRIMS